MHGTRLVYSKVVEGSECYQASFTGFSADPKDNDIRIESKKVGAGVHHRPQHRAGRKLDVVFGGASGR